MHVFCNFQIHDTHEGKKITKFKLIACMTIPTENIALIQLFLPSDFLLSF